MRGGTYHHVEQPADAERRWRRRPEGERSDDRPEIFDQRAGVLARTTTAEEQHAR